MRGRRYPALHRVKHVLRDTQSHQGINQQGLAPALDETRVAPAPCAIGLKPGVAAIAEIV